MTRLLKIAAGILFGGIIILFTLVRLAFEMIGASTAPDDFQLLKERMPDVLEWLFTTPWIVPTLIILAATALSAWLIWSGVKGAAFETTQPDGTTIVAGLSADDVEGAISRRLGDLQRETVGETFHASDARAATMVKHFETRCDDLMKAIQALAGSTAAVDNEQFDRLDQMTKDREKWDRKFEIWTEKRAEDLDRRFDNLDQSLRAIPYREWHERLFRELDDDFKKLAAPVEAGQGIADWESWDVEERSWRGKLDQWLSIADYFAMNTAEAVRQRPDNLFYGDWSFDEKTLANADQVCRYKELAILWRNAKEAKPRVDKCFNQACFLGGSKVGRLGPPPPSLDQRPQRQ